MTRAVVRPSNERTWISATGKQLADCQHLKASLQGDLAGAIIPGLDASYCKVCRVWWVDQKLRNALLKRGSEVA